jgi:hypothetical protein
VRLDKEQQEKAQQEAERRVREQKAKDTELAMRVANSSPAPGQELTPEAQQLKDAAADMLDSTNDPSFVAGYVQRKLAQSEQTRRQQRGSGTGK